ncbi:hypothetical protein GALMADRAFT_228192 [Galerina marginata CBS 339.88]|uniref:F-box domain-containing protein n=1 Tax=Galerina marginata (strain CBS 339.88) TaxID=685588 RepID=A0A067T1B3_GALM3|nr:hypothetical protein GALMADRAFT_228192 [Galerina marginata CBS 339.88]
MELLGFDIFSNIVEHLNNSDKEESQALKALSLSCRALLPLCQAVIFRKVDFLLEEESNEYTQCAGRGLRFFEVLGTSPHIAAYVHSFTYGMNESDLSDYFALSTVTYILSSFTRLREFHLIWDTYWRGSRRLLNWTHLLNHLNDACRLFCRAVEKLLKCEDLVSIKIHCISFFPFQIFTQRAKVMDVDEDEGIRVKMTIVERATEPPTFVSIRNYSTGMAVAYRTHRRDLLPVRGLNEVRLSELTCLQSESPESESRTIPAFAFHATGRVSFCLDESVEGMDLMHVEKILRLACSMKTLDLILKVEVKERALQTITQTILSGSIRTLQALNLHLKNPEEPFEVICKQIELLSRHSILQNLELIIYRNYPDLVHLDLKRFVAAFHRDAFPHLKTFELTFRLVHASDFNYHDELVPSMPEIRVLQLAQLGSLMSMEGLKFGYTLEWGNWSEP